MMRWSLSSSFIIVQSEKYKLINLTNTVCRNKKYGLQNQRNTCDCYNQVGKLVTQSWRDKRPANYEIIAFLFIIIFHCPVREIHVTNMANTVWVDTFAPIIVQFEQIQFAIFTNTSCNLYRYIQQFVQIHSAIKTNTFFNLDKYILFPRLTSNGK